MTARDAKVGHPSTTSQLVRGPDPNAPYRRRNLREVRLVVRALANDLYSKPWKGKSGLTDRSAYIALLRLAWAHGELIPASGVWVSVSMRQWAELAGVRLPTINKTKARLTHEHALIRRDGRGHGPRNGAFVLLCGPERIETLIQNVSNKDQNIEEDLECFISRVALRWGSGKLGKTKEALLDGVRRLGFPTEKELAVLLDREGGVHHLRKHLEELVGLVILERRGGRYQFSELGAFCLNFERASNGELDTAERVRADHALQRERFVNAWEKGEVRSRSAAPSPSVEVDETAVREPS